MDLKIKLLLMLSLVVLANGCATTARVERELGSSPDNWKQLVKEAVVKSFFDPHSIRDVTASPPGWTGEFGPSGYLVCMESNSKNRMGGYTGLQRTGFVIDKGSVVRVMNNPYQCRSSVGLNSVMFPWPELEEQLK